MESIRNPRWPHKCRIYREIVQENPFGETDLNEELVLYEGKCRSYPKQTTRDTGEVVTSMRVLSIPRRLNDWEREIQTGDLVEVEKGVFTEYGKVKDFLPNNLGTDVLWLYGRN